MARENIPPEMLALLEDMIQGGLAEDQQALLQAQIEQAQQFRNTPMPGGRTVRDQYIAANPLEVANATLRQIMGGQAENAIRGQQYGNLAKSQEGVRSQLMAQLLREYAPAPEQAPIPSSQYADAALNSPDPTALAAANPFPVPWETSGSSLPAPRRQGRAKPFSVKTGSSGGGKAGGW